MKVIALLSWWEESPSWLSAATASAARLADHIVAVDGAYEHVPDGRPSSGPEQADAIRLAAEAAGIGCTIHVPRDTWRGDEVAKRSFMFAAGQLVAEPDRDWFLVIDADEVVTECQRALVHDQLLDTDLNVATVTLEQYVDHSARGEHLTEMEHRTSHPARRLLRADVDPIQVVGQHWHYVRAGESLWGRGESDAQHIDGLRMEHRTHLRSRRRRAAQQTYYRVRDALRLESAPAKLEAAA